MYYVYILLLNNRQLYCGKTKNLQRRFLEHTQGKSPSTKNRLPVRLIFYEAYTNDVDATRRERYLKTAKGKSSLRAMLRHTI